MTTPLQHAAQAVIDRVESLAKAQQRITECILQLRKDLDAEVQQQAEPVVYLAWRDGKPCWDGDDCVCEEAVYPVDIYDDRISIPLYLHPPKQAVPHGWMIEGCSRVWKGEHAEIDATAEAKRCGGTCKAYPVYTAPQAKQVPLSDEEIWESDPIMATNRGYGATFKNLRAVIKAVEAHHGITGGQP